MPFRSSERLGEATDRFQNYTTAGLFQRTDSGFSWAAVYDHLYQNSYDRYSLGQVRGLLAYQFDSQNEIGGWGTIATKQDTGNFGGAGGAFAGDVAGDQHGKPVLASHLAQSN